MRALRHARSQAWDPRSKLQGMGPKKQKSCNAWSLFATCTRHVTVALCVDCNLRMPNRLDV
eukprot:363499-Chlamydomonas_euryale.AAC.3